VVLARFFSLGEEFVYNEIKECVAKSESDEDEVAELPKELETAPPIGPVDTRPDIRRGQG